MRDSLQEGRRGFSAREGAIERERAREIARECERESAREGARERGRARETPVLQALIQRK